MNSLKLQDLLVGQTYYSYNRNFSGEIVEAKQIEKFYDTHTFRIRVRESGFPTYHYAIIKVEVD
jgi:hypothetical protein